MKKKNIPFIIIVCILTLAFEFKSFSVCASEVNSDIFSGNATYLLQEHFETSQSISIDGKNNRKISGWDIDYRGGSLISSGSAVKFVDGDDGEQVKMNHKLISHQSGNLVLETAFSIDDCMTEGFYYSLLGGTKSALFISVYDGFICVLNQNGGYEKIKRCEVNTVYFVKAILSFDNKIVDFYINGTDEGTFSLTTPNIGVDEIEIGTSVLNDCFASIYFVDLYINYTVNETFKTTPAGAIPADWNFTGGGNSGVSYAPGSPYDDDVYGFNIVNSKENPNVCFEKNISGLTDSNVTFSANFIVPERHGGTVIKIGDNENAINFEISENDFYLNNTVVLSNYRENLWYNIEIRYGKKEGTVDFYVNNKLFKGGIFCSEINFGHIKISKSSVGFGNVIVDDIRLFKTFEKYSDYPSLPEVSDNGDFNVGMMLYPMWREGVHYGWDTISPYCDERKSYLGYYTDGSREVSDWNNKWMLEHGIDYAIYPFVRPQSESGEPVKIPIRGEALLEGYMHSEYSDKLDFAIMLSSFGSDNYYGVDDFKQNVLPYITEYYLKDPRYKVIENKPIIYTFDLKSIVNVLGGGDTKSGCDSLNEIINSIRSAAQDIGFDDIIFVADVSQGNSKDLTKNFEGIYEWRYTWYTDQPSYIGSILQKEFEKNKKIVASIPMGFDTTPWRTSKIGFLSPDGIETLCQTVKEIHDTYDTDKLVTFTCWDEFGEGHFFAPSQIYGFSYLNKIKSVFTGCEADSNESTPSDEAVERMGVLYHNRHALKTVHDKVTYSDDEISKMEQLLKITFTSSSDVSKWKPANCTTYYNFIDKSMVCTPTKKDPYVKIDLSDLDISVSDISAVRICAYTEYGKDITLHYSTTDEENFGNYKNFYTVVDGTNVYGNYILTARDESRLTGKLLYLRIDPSDDIADYGGKFAIKSVELLSGNKPTEIRVNNNKVDLVSDVLKDDTLYIPVYKLLVSDMGAYAVWDFKEETLTCEKYGNAVKIKSGEKTIYVNGVAKQISHAPYYYKGDMYVPYEGVLEELGYSVTYENNVISYTNESYISNIDENLIWDFENRGNAEGFTGNGAAKLSVRDGFLRVASTSMDPFVTKSDLSINPSDFNYALICLKKTDSAEIATFRIINENGDMLNYKFNVYPDSDVTQYIIDLNSNDGFSDFGTVKSIRFDPMENTGEIFIDMICVLSDYPSVTYGIDAYTWGSNMTIPVLSAGKTDYGLNNVLNNGENNFPIEEDGDDYLINIVPEDTGSDALFSIKTVNYKGEVSKIDSLCDDNCLIKVSFKYKSYGNCTEIDVENRKASFDIANRVRITDNISSEVWNEAECVFDLTNSTTESTNPRWITLRVKSNKGEPNPGIQIKDLSVVCLDDTKSVSVLNDNGIVFRVTETNMSPFIRNKKFSFYIAEYDEKNLLKKASVFEFDPDVKQLDKGYINYVYDYNSDDCNKIKCFLWEDLIPICGHFQIEK